MEHVVKCHGEWGESLFINNGVVEIGIPLAFGIRIGHYSFCGEKNVLFEQPLSMTDLTTKEGWRVRGGHRLWMAPESALTYYPDNDEIAYNLTDNGVNLIQKREDWLNIQKSVSITLSEDSHVFVDHTIRNLGDSPIDGSCWAITSVAPGGSVYIKLMERIGGYNPLTNFSIWDHTSLGDSRAQYNKDSIWLNWKGIKDRYKIGIGHPVVPIMYFNEDTIFKVSYSIDKDCKYPDGNVSFESFLCVHMIEIETLSPIRTIQPGECVTHQEVWCLERKVSD